MKALRLHRVGDLRLHDEPIPDPGVDEVLVRVTAVGICGSDLHWLMEAGIGDAHLDKPLVLGHEFAGVVESGELRGQRVAVDPTASCGECEFCLEGNPNLCIHHRFLGHGLEDGAMREYLAWSKRCIFPLPDVINDVEAAMLEPLGVAIHAVDLGHIRPGMSVGIFGCGPIGLLTLQMARLAGASPIYATEILQHRLEAALELGASAALPADRGRESEEILKLTGGRGVDVAFEASDENEAVEAAIRAAKPGGRVILIGIPSDDRTSFSASIARRKGLTLALIRRMKHTYPRAIRLVRDGQIDVRSMVTGRYPLEDYETALAASIRREGIKIILEP